MEFETVKWVGGAEGYLEIVDQRVLPGKFVKLKCKTVQEVWEAIKTLAVRGAPAIGVAAGYGVCVALRKMDARCDVDDVEKAADYLATSRPTAVNLFWAIDRMKKVAQCATGDMRETLLAEANEICEEDKRMCRAIGVNGEKFIAEGAGVLTHCNAGALATAGQGTALSPMYEAHRRGRKFRGYADETRPLLQGARLTAWELCQAKIDVTLVCDNMAGGLMKAGKVDAVITGADRIAANGDAANKIGTASLSILAKEYGIPFYIAAPSSTFDLSIASGDDIPIEERGADEVKAFGGTNVAPEGVKVYNPAFDVTDAANITAIITEKGVIESPDTGKIAACLKS